MTEIVFTIKYIKLIKDICTLLLPTSIFTSMLGMISLILIKNKGKNYLHISSVEKKLKRNTNIASKKLFIET